jgi:hypothetical protein
MDATRFNRAFPHAPLLGFMAGGEIGPRAYSIAINNQVGSVAVQGFTACFGLFSVPVQKVGLVPLQQLESCHGNVSDVLASMLQQQ